MLERISLINDIETDYKKLGNECKKKYNTIREVIDISLKAISKLKDIENDKEKFKAELSVSIEILIKPIMIITEGKHVKLYLQCIIILKKLVIYNFITSNESNNIIKFLKEIFDNSLEDIQLKVLETLQSMISSNNINYNQTNIDNIMIICCKTFSFKNIEFKNPIKLIFQILIKGIFENINIEIANNFIRNLVDIIEGKKKEWIIPSIYSKSLGLELISLIIESFYHLFLKEEKLMKIIDDEVSHLLKRTLTITNDALIGIKSCRCSLIIIKKLKTCYDLIDHILKYAERDNTLTWQKIIGLEGLSEIIKDHNLLFDLYTNNFQIYENILNSLTDITYKNVVMKPKNDNNQNSNLSNQNTPKNSNKKVEISNLKNSKYIDNNQIITEGEINPNNITTSSSYAYKLLIDCYVYLKDSFINIMEGNGIKVNTNIDIKSINELNETQIKIKDMLNYKYVAIKGALIGLMINSNDDVIIQTYLNIFQSYISIFAAINLNIIRDEFINDLCKLAIPNNLSNSYEIKEKNILITRAIFNIAHCVNLLDSNSWVLLIETIQNLYFLLINSGNYLLKINDQFNIDVIMKNIEMNIKKYSYDTPCDEIHEIIKESEINVNFKKNNSNNINSNTVIPTPKSSDKKKKIIQNLSPNKQLTNEERDNINILSNVVDTLFIDSNTYDENTLKDISKALHDTSKKLIENYNKLISKEKNSENNINDINNNNQSTILTYLNFNLVKILECGVINVNRIYLIWDDIVDVINMIIINTKNNINDNKLTKFTIDALTIIIIWIILKYKPKENNNDKDDHFSIINWQNTIFTPIFYIINHYPQNILFLLSDLNRILQKCGINLNNNGWNSFINILDNILSNNKVDTAQTENVFKLVEQIFNEYSSYLTIFNIDLMLNILEKFSLNKENNNICYSAVALFWQCADITENFQKGKINLTQNQTEIYEKFLPDKQKQDEFFSKEWKNIFIKLININDDKRFDIRKSGINVFAQFFVAKINAMNILKINNISVSMDIINTVFFEIAKKNVKYYMSNNRVVIQNVENNSVINQNLKEWEDTIILTLQAIGKIVKGYFETNILNEESINNKSEIYDKITIMCNDIIKYLTPEIGINILKVLCEIYGSDQKLFCQYINQIWSILDNIKLFLNNEEAYIKKYGTSVIGGKLISNIIEAFKQIFSKRDNFKEYEIELKRLCDFIPELYYPISLTEGSIVINNPQKVLRVEKELYEFIDELISNSEKSDIKYLINLLLSYIQFDPKNSHSDALCRKSFESIEKIYSKYKNNEYLLNEILPKIIEKIKPILLCRTSNESVSILIRNTKSKNKYLWNFICSEFITKIIEKIIFYLKNDNIWEKIIQLFTEIFKQSELGYNMIDKLFQEELIKSCQDMEVQIINFIVNVLLPNAIYIENSLQTKLLSLLDIGSNIDYKEHSNSFLSISKMCLNNLFELCKYKSNEDIKKEFEKISPEGINQDEIKERLEHFLEIRIKISKMCTPILLKRSIEIIKKYIDDEIKSGAMPLSRNRIEEVKYILEELKNLEIFPDSEIYENKVTNNFSEAIAKSKKGHLFVLHYILSEFITTKENDIKMLIKQIFKIISFEMGLNYNN